MKLVFLHGIHQDNKNPTLLKESWLNSLKSGCEAIGHPIDVSLDDVIMPFYGDILVENMPKKKGSRSRSGPKTGFDLFAEKIYPEMMAHSLERGEVTTDRGKGIHKKPLKKVVRAIEAISPLRGTIALRLLKQAYAYLMLEKCRAAVDAVVKPNLNIDEPAIIIAHSLGTIVGYRMLLELQEEGKLESIPLFLTMGSPLSLKLIKTHLGLEPKPIEKVSSWVNLTDKEDFVALGNKLDGKYFKMSIENDLSLDNGYDDPHSLEKYISSEPACSKMLEFIT